MAEEMTATGGLAAALRMVSTPDRSPSVAAEGRRGQAAPLDARAEETGERVPMRAPLLASLEQMRKASDKDWAELIDAIHSFANHQRRELARLETWLGIARD